VQSEDLPSIYEVPVNMQNQGLDEAILKRFGMTKPSTLKNFKVPKPVAPPVIQDQTDIYNNTNISENNKNEEINNEEPKKEEIIDKNDNDIKTEPKKNPFQSYDINNTDNINNNINNINKLDNNVNENIIEGNINITNDNDIMPNIIIPKKEDNKKKALHY